METEHNTHYLTKTWEIPGKKGGTVRLDIDGNTLWITEDQQAELLAALREANVPHAIHQPEEGQWWHQGARWGAFIGIAGGFVAVILPVALETAAAWFSRVAIAAQDLAAGLLSLLAALIIPACLVALAVVLVWWWLHRIPSGSSDPPAERRPARPEEPPAGVTINNITNVFHNHSDHV